MKFPILKEEYNKVTTLDGTKSYVYTLTPSDLEQFSYPQAVDLKRKFSNFYKTIEENDFFKIYSISDKIYLNTNRDEIEVPGYVIDKLETPLNVLFGENDIFSAINFNKFDNTFKLNDEYVYLVNLYDFPRNNIKLSFLQNFDCDYYISFKRVSHLQSKLLLDRKRREHNPNRGKEMQDVENDKAYDDTEGLLDEIINGNETLFRIEAWIILKNESKKKLNQTLRELLKALREKNTTGLVESYPLNQKVFNSYIFGTKPLFSIYKKTREHHIQGSYLSNLLPLTKDHVHEQGINFKSISHKDTFLNVYDEKCINYNVLISGTSGGGKSFLINKLVSENLNLGRNVISVEFGYSQEKQLLCKKGLSLSKSFDPLISQDPRFLKELILSVIPKNEITGKEEGIIFDIIQEILDKNDLHSFPHLISLVEDKYPGIKYYFSEILPLLEGKELKESPYIYVDTKDYPERLYPILFTYLAKYVDQMKGDKFFNIDEGWLFLKRNEFFTSTLFRTGRKEKMGTLFSCQNIMDLFSDKENSLGRVIDENTFHKIFFRQPISNYKGLIESEKRKVESLCSEKGVFSEFFYKSQFHNKIMRYFASLSDKEMFHTELDEHRRFIRFFDDRTKYFDGDEIFNQWMNLKYGGTFEENISY